MGNVFIIKNNDLESDIYKFAKESFEKKEKRYYNSLPESDNEGYIKKKKNLVDNSNCIILFITYDGENENKIENILIGDDVKITENFNIEYEMKVYLSREKESATIESIVDKIDLDLSKDFEKNCYVIMSSMESLYDELRERTISQEKNTLLNDESYEGKKEECGNYQLSKLAQRDFQALRIYKNNQIDKFRTEFQRDRERVVNCKAFRRLVDKAQIFSADKGDYYRTRMTHSLEVNQIAKAIAYALELNLDLTEAIALGHDLGHTPFGHQGERTLDEILSGKIDVGIVKDKGVLKKRFFGGFKHNYQSAKILTQLEEKYVDFPGLNVSAQVIEGVLKHTKMKDEIELSDFLNDSYIDKISFVKDEEKQICATLEGQTVAIADEIAQRGHDVDDALTSGVMSIEEFIDRLKIEKCQELRVNIEREIENVDKADRTLTDKKELKIARIVSCIINYMINSTIKNSREKINESKINEITMDNSTEFICFSEEVSKVNSYLERVVQKKVICNNEVARADYNASMIVKKLFEKYYRNPRLLHEGTIHKIFIETLAHKNINVSNSAVNLSDGSIKIVNKEIDEVTNGDIDFEKIEDYMNKGKMESGEKDVIIFEKRKILIRCIVDYIAGMTDGYALEEYEKLK